MSFTLLLNLSTWRQHIDSVNSSVSAHAEMIPVIKGNGYGLGQHRLSHEAARLGSPCIAVGTVFELPDILDVFAGDVVVLEPFDPRDVSAAAVWARVLERPDGQRVIRTVARPSALHALAQANTSGRIRMP